MLFRASRAAAQAKDSAESENDAGEGLVVLLDHTSQRLGSEQTLRRVSWPHSSATPTTSIALRVHPIAHPGLPFRNHHAPEEPLWPLNSVVVRRAGCFCRSQHSIACAVVDFATVQHCSKCTSGVLRIRVVQNVPTASLALPFSPSVQSYVGSPMLVQAFIGFQENQAYLCCRTVPPIARALAHVSFDVCSMNPRRFVCHLRHRQVLARLHAFWRAPHPRPPCRGLCAAHLPLR